MGGSGLSVSRYLRCVFAAFACLAWACSHAQQKPPVDDGPKFEIKRFVYDGATLIPKEIFDLATEGFVGPGKTFGDVQRALEVVEKLYSSNGWSAVQVLLPEQELERGEVRFQIVEAKVGRVLVEGNKFFDEANIRASLPALKPGSAPNINRIARNLRVANENPAKQTTVLLRSGQEEATVDAVARVVDENPVRMSVTIDSTGSAQTGKFRTGFGYQNSNVLGRDHNLTLQYVTAPHDDVEPNRVSLLPSKNVFVLGMGYRIPLYERGDAIDFTAGYSNVNSGTVANLFNIAGAGGLWGLRYTKNLDKKGDYEHRFAYSYDYKGYSNDVTAVGSTVKIVPDYTVHPVTILYFGQYRGEDSETGGSLGVSQNFPGGNDGRGTDICQSRSNSLGECAQGRYMIWRWALNHSRALGGDFQMRFAMNGQLTRDMLVPGEQFGIGGVDSVRGFLEREISNDNGYRGTFELYSPDWGGKIGIDGTRARAVVFYDWAGVSRIRPAPAEAHAQHISSTGFGLRFSRGTNAILRFDYAVVQDPGGSQGRGDGRLHGSFSYIF